MTRGDFVKVALQGDFGKPRPALVVQANQFDETATVTVLLVTSTIADIPLLRITVAPTLENGLQKLSQIMIDKVMTLKRERLGAAFGHATDEEMLRVGRSLAVFLGIV